MSARSNAGRSAARAADLPSTQFLIVVAAVALALLSMLSAGVLARPVDAASRPTIVLVHGAWAGPGGWDEVAAALHKDGYLTAAPALGLQDMAADVATVRSALDGINGSKILVGHSYGGAVISQASAGRSDVLGLVYTAAFVPDQGESLLTLGQGYTPPAALAHLVFSGAPFASPSTIDPAYFRADFAADLNPKLAAALSSQQTPTSLAIFGQPAGPVGWHTIPSWYAVSAADRMIDPALQRAMAQQIGATTSEFDDASHAGGYTHYATRLVKLIEAAAASGG